MAEPRTAKQVIDQAIKENLWGERLCYGLVVIFAGVGVAAIFWGMIRGEGLVALAGGISSALFWPALHYARQIRKENIAIRLLEVPLSMATTAESAAQALEKAFTKTFASKTSETHVQS